MMFSFGGDTGMSYEALQRKRKITDALMQQKNKPMDAANGLAQGLSSVAGALLGKKLDKREDQMRSDRQGQFTDLFGGGAPTAGAAAPTAGQVQQGAASMGGETKSAFDVAAQKIGLNERDQNAALSDFLKTGGQNLDPATTAWCAAFVNASLKQAGGEGTGKLNARSFLKWGEEVSEPQKGDVAVFSRGDPNGWQGHVGFFDGANEDGTIRVLGGNQKDGVNISNYPADRLLGYRRQASGGQAQQGAPQGGARLAQLAQFAADPLLDPAQRKIAEIMLQREMQQGDPMTQLDMQYKQAQIDKMNNPAPAKRETQYVDGVGLIDKATGDVLKQYDTPAKDRPMKQGADKRWRYTDGDKEMVFPDVDANGGNDMTESERRIFMFNSIQKQTGPAINMIEENGFNPSNMKDRFANGVLGGNWLKSQDGQMYDAAAGAWSESALRLATGAAATPEEYDRIKGMYFAQVGDTPETIEFKRAMRESYEGVLGRTLSGDQGEAPNPLMFAIEQFYNDKNGAKPAGAPEVPTGAPAAGIAAPEGGFNFGQMSLPDLSQIDVLSLPREQQDEWEKRMNILMQQNEGGR